MQPTPSKPKRSTLSKILIGAVALIVACCGLSVIGSALFPRQPISPTPTTVAQSSLVELAATKSPTEVPQPTMQPTVQPTIQPTAQPAATPTEPTNDVALRQTYLLSLSKIMQRAGQNLKEFSELSSLAGKTPALVQNTEWKLKVVLKLATMKQNALEFKALSAPAEMEAADKLVKEMADHLDSAATHYAEGIDEMSADKIQAAVSDLGEVTRLINEIGKASGF